MRFLKATTVALTSLLAFVTPLVSGTKLIESTSLNTCQDQSNFTASLFNVVFTPDNATITFKVQAVSTISGNVTFGVLVQVYGYTLLQTNLDPCDLGLPGLCPMNQGTITIDSNFQNLSSSIIKQIPAIAYGIPDLDALVTVHINSTANPLVSQACLQARLSNGQTVDQKGVGWATAAIAGLGLVASAIVSGLGHSNTAAHLATYALFLFGYFQSIAIIGLIATPMPPIVQSWTQNFMWSMGIIEVHFMQTIATWYQTATGGTPSTVLNTLTTTSVQVVKRSQIATTGVSLFNKAWAMSPKVVPATIKRAAALIPRNSDYQNTINSITGTYVVRGINRVAFKAGMEATNVFLTGLIFFCAFMFFVIVGVLIFKGIIELAVRQKWMKGDKFLDFRNGWQLVLKGIMFRIVLIGWPQITILCLWEFTQVDSPAEVVLAVFFFFGMGATLGFAAWKVFSLAKRSQQMHKNAAYILYSDPTALNKWGFLYVQFRATAYFYILPILIYTLVKAFFVSIGQPSGAVQAIAFFIVEGLALIAASVVRPWMDKPTNTLGISICAINWVNAIFLLFFSNIFNQPALATGIVGVLLFIFNAIFALGLLIFVLVFSILSLFRKNPDARYQPMSDDRNSFMKSQTALNTELDALGATARGDGKGGYKHGLDLDDDDTDSWNSDALRQKEASATVLPPSTANSQRNYAEPPRSPIDPSQPFLGANTSYAPHPQAAYNDNPRGLYADQYGGDTRQTSDQTMSTGRASPAPQQYGRGTSSHSNTAPSFRQQNNASPAGRAQNNASPWQRGAGYDH